MIKWVEETGLNGYGIYWDINMINMNKYLY